MVWLMLIPVLTLFLLTHLYATGALTPANRLKVTSPPDHDCDYPADVPVGANANWKCPTCRATLLLWNDDGRVRLVARTDPSWRWHRDELRRIKADQ